MLQHETFDSRPRSIQTVFVWVAVALLMSVGSVQAASTAPSNHAADRSAGLVWEFIFGDPVMGCVMPNGDLWVAPVNKGPQLQAATGVQPTQQTLEYFITNLPNATSGDMVRFEGGVPDSEAVTALANRDYDTETTADPSTGFDSAVEYTP